ncbi:MAG: hypothetical protein ACR2ME_00880 [Acidimicrobiia bacterium]
MADAWITLETDDIIFHAGSTLEIDFNSDRTGLKKLVHLIVNSCGSLWQTNDGGASWDAVKCLPANGPYAIDDDGTGWIIAETYETTYFQAALFSTNDGGRSWIKPSIEGLDPSVPNWVVVDLPTAVPSGASLVAITEGANGPLTWRSCRRTPPKRIGRVSRICP